MLGLGLSAQNRQEKLDSAVVSAARAGKKTPVTFTVVEKKDLRSADPNYSLPMLLNFQPSVNAFTEGGTGLGYSKLSVRGILSSHINVTLNGITLNDAESQEVFWVNIPALGQLLSSVQLQRGLGTTANGPGAFGASINMSTGTVSAKPSARVDLGFGSYKTFTQAYSFNTGLLKKGFYLSGAFSSNKTDGYIRNAKANVKSAMLSTGWLGESNSVKFIWLMGSQHTGITWNGISLEQYGKDRRYNPAGEYTDKDGVIKYYDNETDNYRQNHFQLSYTHIFDNNMIWRQTLNYTKGYGYYENYKANKKFSKYAMSNYIDAQGNTIKKSDFIVRQILDNNYVVLNSDLSYTKDKLKMNFGIYNSWYINDHIGKVLWSSVLDKSFDYDNFIWYSNTGDKNEINLYANAQYSILANLNAYVDVQYRHINLDMRGPDKEALDLKYSRQWDFFNPKGGLNWEINSNNSLYTSIAVGHREPGRADLKDIILMNTKISDKSQEKNIVPERMIDYELGYHFTSSRFSASATAYWMEYKDMLLQTGKLGDTGYPIKENVGSAFRRGLEFSMAVQVLKSLSFNANMTLSQNTIRDYTHQYDSYQSDNYDEYQTLNKYMGDRTMLKSPSVLAFAQIDYKPIKYLSFFLNAKYVSSQYWDNTQDEAKKIPAYYVSNAGLNVEVPMKYGTLGFSAFCNNILNRNYYADAWVSNDYIRAEDKFLQYEGVFPQALRNFMFKLYYQF